METNNTSKHLLIFGRVQGVYYRAWSAQTAEELGLTGWVRNRRDGSVEASVIGPCNMVDRFIEACHDGPDKANVERIDINNGKKEPLVGFEIRKTH